MEFALDKTSFVPSENRRVIGSSAGLGWADIAGVVVDAPDPDENVYHPVEALAVACSFRPFEVEALVGGKSQTGSVQSGSVTIFSPNTRIEVQTRAATLTCHLFMKPAFVSGVSKEIYGKTIDHFDLVSVLGAPDSIISHLMQAFNAMLAEPDGRTFRGDYIASAIASELLTRHAALIDVPRLEENRARLSPRQMEMIRDFLEGSLDGDFHFGDLAASIGLSRTTFFERFTRTTNRTPNQYLQSLRIGKARQLLKETKLPIADVAVASGFADQSHLTRFFKRIVGMSPAHYRRES